MRTLPALELRFDDRLELERRAAGPSPSRSARRAKVILLAAEGLSNRQIGAALGTHYNRVAFWRHRYQELGLAGLEDDERPGRPVIYGPRQVLELVRLLSEVAADGSRWTLASLSSVLADRGIPISRSQVRRLCAALEVNTSFASGTSPASRPLPVGCAIEVIGLCVGAGMRGVFCAVAEPSEGVDLPAVARALAAEPTTRRLLEAMHSGLAQNQPADASGSDVLVRLATKLLELLPTPVTLSCTAVGLAPALAAELASLAPGRFFLHPTTREESWANRLKLLFALVEAPPGERQPATVPSSWPSRPAVAGLPSDPATERAQKLLRSLRRSKAPWVWVSRPPEEVAVAS